LLLLLLVCVAVLLLRLLLFPEPLLVEYTGFFIGSGAFSCVSELPFDLRVLSEGVDVVTTVGLEVRGGLTLERSLLPDGRTG
jgi:hypothetical protein